MKRLALALILAACTPATQDELTRGAARAAVKPVLAERFPGLPLEPVTNCIIDNATSKELLSLAADSVTGPTANTVQIVSLIVRREATVSCLANAALIQAGGGL